VLEREALVRSASARRPDFEAWLKELVDLPSVSVDPAHAADVRRCAEAGCERLRSVGAQAEVLETGGHPLVYGRLPGQSDWPTVILYNHLDVQPAEGSDWRTDPFQLTTDGERYFGRGATDDKGPALTALCGALLAREAGAPINVAFLWELEEEVGSAHFAAALERYRERLARTDSVVVSDTIWVTRGKPSSPAGLRGMQPFRLLLDLHTADLHSGITGGAVRNPLTELMQVIASCVDGRSGEVLIPGFYAAVEPLSTAEEEGFVKSGFSVETFMRDHQTRALRTTDPLEVMRRLWALPTFEVHGVVGGYTGPGVKAAIPPRAEVKCSCRLVPNMTCGGTLDLIRAFVAELNPDVRIEAESGLDPFKGRASGPLADAVREAYRFGFGAEAVFTREGGSIGAVPTMERILGAPVMFLGLSLPEHGYHAPNEHFDWPQAHGGMLAFARYLNLLATPDNQQELSST
jgi:acetylornithine deacetylase/succinyl-diaminopimelate desuccinylase-like protein